MSTPQARDLLGAVDAIARRGCVLGRPLVVVDETASTNDLAKRAAKIGAEHGSTWVADHQSEGRGRQGRVWLAARGESLLFSVLLRVICPVSRLPELALAAGLAVSDALALAAPEARVGVKWPNDVVAGGKKLAGILVESIGAQSNAAALVVGVGVNVHTRSFPPEICDRATSVALLTDAPADRGELLALIVSELDVTLPLVAARGLASIHARLTRADALQGCRVRTTDGVEGVARGIDSAGRLRVACADGSCVSLVAGEVHLVAAGSVDAGLAADDDVDLRIRR